MLQFPVLPLLTLTLPPSRPITFLSYLSVDTCTVMLHITRSARGPAETITERVGHSLYTADTHTHTYTYQHTHTTQSPTLTWA